MLTGYGGVFTFQLSHAYNPGQSMRGENIFLLGGKRTSMLKVIPVEEAVGLPLAHDITEIVPGKHKGPAFRRGHIIRPEDVSKLLDVGKANIYVMELEKGELHEEDAARRLAKAAAGPNIRLTDPVEGRVNLVAQISGLLKVDSDLLYRFNSLGDLILATLPENRYVRQGDVGGPGGQDAGRHSAERRESGNSRISGIARFDVSHGLFGSDSRHGSFRLRAPRSVYGV